MSQKIKITTDYLFRELNITASKSSGPGGQHVNKVNTKVDLRWDVVSSKFLNEEEKKIILKKLRGKITNEGVLLLSAQNKRSQLFNKIEVFRKLDQLLELAFSVHKKRKPTKPTYSSVKKRLESKKRQSEKKKRRKGL